MANAAEYLLAWSGAAAIGGVLAAATTELLFYLVRAFRGRPRWREVRCPTCHRRVRVKEREGPPLPPIYATIFVGSQAGRKSSLPSHRLNGHSNGKENHS